MFRRPVTLFTAALSLLQLVLAPSLSSQGLPLARPEEVGMSSERLERLEEAFDEYVEADRLAGGVTLVARHGKVVFYDAFGDRDREANDPMREDAIFRIASQSKALVSVGIMMLQEEGKLLLSDPLSRYIPEFREMNVAVPREGGGYDLVPARRGITIRDLLSHTSGLSYGTGPSADAWRAAGIQNWYFADRNEPVAATISRLAALPLDSQPGERWVYGFSTDVLGVVIERVSGLPLDEFIRDRITQPLGMTDTHFYLPPDKANRLAVVYSGVNGGVRRAPDEGTMESQGAYLNGPRKSFSGGAGLLSTASDYARFLQMLLNGGELDGVRILGPKSIELMTVSHMGDIEYRAGQGFGLGFSVVEDLGARGIPGSEGEFGWSGAYHSTYWVDPEEDLVVVYFTQIIPTGGVDDQAKLRALVYQALVD